MNRLIYCSLKITILMFILLNVTCMGSCGPNYESILKDMTRLDSPSKIRVYLQNFTYERDRGVTIEPMIKDPFLFVKDHKGDCKDFANFAYRCGILHGKDVDYLSIYPKDKSKNGHAFCLWKENSKFYPLCNYTCQSPFVRHEFNSLGEIITFYQKAFNWIEVNYPRECFPLPYGLLYYPRIPDSFTSLFLNNSGTKDPKENINGSH